MKMKHIYNLYSPWGHAVVIKLWFMFDLCSYVSLSNALKFYLIAKAPLFTCIPFFFENWMRFFEIGDW